MTHCTCIGSSRHLYLCFSLSVSISAYITANSACICTSLYLCFPLTFCHWMCIPVSEYIIILDVYVRLLIRVSVSLFCMIVYVCVRLYRHWLYVYRYVSYSAYVSIPLSLSVSGYIIGNLYVCEQTSSARSVCIALWKIYVLLLILRVYVRVLIRTSVSLSLS